MLELLRLWCLDTRPCEKQAMEGPTEAKPQQTLSVSSPEGESSYSTSPEL